MTPSGARLRAVIERRMQQREFLGLRHATGEELAVSGIESRKTFYGYVVSGEYSSRTLMQFPKREWSEVVDVPVLQFQ